MVDSLGHEWSNETLTTVKGWSFDVLMCSRCHALGPIEPKKTGDSDGYYFVMDDTPPCQGHP